MAPFPATGGARILVRDPGLARSLGRAGKEHARERFLTPRLLRDWLRLFTDLEV
jgi:trehalose synthase